MHTVLCAVWPGPSLYLESIKEKEVGSQINMPWALEYPGDHSSL